MPTPTPMEGQVAGAADGDGVLREQFARLPE